jgi:hypothetical protein
MLSREDAEVRLHALQTMTEQLSCVNGDIAIVENYHCLETACGSWDAPDYPTCLRNPLQ